MVKTQYDISDINQAARLFRDMLIEMEYGDRLYIMSGEGSHGFYDVVEEQIRRHHDQKGMPVNIIVGPMLSVDDNGESPILRLGRDGIADVLVSEYRTSRHSIVFGNSLLDEEYHLPGSSNRKVTKYSDILAAAVTIGSFENQGEVHCKPWNGDDGVFLKVTDDELARFHWEREYEFSKPPVIAEALSEMRAAQT